ncbi:MAG: 4Fe-4S binding protein, partial [Bacteroidetes bacterium]|nr:4Fe-4S binding protein [Bacteroidota bacterium]
IVLLLSLFIKRPWCNYLCPIDPIMDLVLASHRWIKQEFRKIWQLKNLKKNS